MSAKRAPKAPKKKANSTTKVKSSATTAAAKKSGFPAEGSRKRKADESDQSETEGDSKTSKKPKTAATNGELASKTKAKAQPVSQSTAAPKKTATTKTTKAAAAKKTTAASLKKHAPTVDRKRKADDGSQGEDEEAHPNKKVKMFVPMFPNLLRLSGWERVNEINEIIAQNAARDTSHKDGPDAVAQPSKATKKSSTTATANKAPSMSTSTNKPKAAPESKPRSKPSSKPSKKPAVPAIGKKINDAPTERLDIYVFGEGGSGELGLGSNKVDGKKPTDVKRPRLNHNLSADDVGVVQIACGGMHAAALTHDNKILTWGVNDQGALGRDTKWDDSEEDDNDSGLNPKESSPGELSAEFFAPGTKFVQVVACDSSTFALTEDGRVYGWGTFRVRTRPAPTYRDTDADETPVE
jgi:regulator of chromosome condensation